MPKRVEIQQECADWRCASPSLLFGAVCTCCFKCLWHSVPRVQLLSFIQLWVIHWDY